MSSKIDAVVGYLNYLMDELAPRLDDLFHNVLSIMVKLHSFMDTTMFDILAIVIYCYS